MDWVVVDGFDVLQVQCIVAFLEVVNDDADGLYCRSIHCQLIVQDDSVVCEDEIINRNLQSRGGILKQLCFLFSTYLDNRVLFRLFRVQERLVDVFGNKPVRLDGEKIRSAVTADAKLQLVKVIQVVELLQHFILCWQQSAASRCISAPLHFGARLGRDRPRKPCP